MVQMVKKWIAEDGSEHDSKQAAEQNALRMKAADVIDRHRADESFSPLRIVDELNAAGLLNLHEVKPRKPREPKADKQAKAPKAAKQGNGAAVQ